LFTNQFSYFFPNLYFKVERAMARKFSISLVKDNIRKMVIEEAKKQKSALKKLLAAIYNNSFAAFQCRKLLLISANFAEINCLTEC